MSEEQQLSPLEDAAEDGDVPRFRDVLRSGNFTRQDLVDSMDTAYRGTKVTPPITGCAEIVSILRGKGLTVPTYEFHARQVVRIGESWVQAK